MSALADKLEALKPALALNASQVAEKPKGKANIKHTSAKAQAKAVIATACASAAEGKEPKRVLRSLEDIYAEMKELFSVCPDSFQAYVAFTKRRANVLHSVLSSGNPRALVSFIAQEADCLMSVQKNFNASGVISMTRQKVRPEATAAGVVYQATIDGRLADVVFKD